MDITLRSHSDLTLNSSAVNYMLSEHVHYALRTALVPQ